ncbi:RagB/SusD family nutrient uptake outer membrane protein [Gramella sp. BOM4]|nr:RagB/SusD family nutrient uptake outer membrane protein [Christiangramia bathymodioli]
MKTYHYKIMFILMLTISTGCEDQLEEEVFSELAPSTLFTSEKGLNSLLNAAYSSAHRSGFDQSWSPYFLGTMPAGEVWGVGGSIESVWQSLIDYNWDSNHGQLLPVWTTYYNSIRDANIVLDNLDNDAFSSDFRQRTEAEVHFLRGWAYSELYKYFGRLPLYKSSTDDPLLPRSSDEETRAFIEQELLEAIATLPTEPLSFGRASKGVAMSVLAKFYLNTKQWQKAADMSLEVIELGQYNLLPNYSDVFEITNEGNSEIIWALPKDAAGAGQFMNALIFPPDYPTPYPNNSVYAARTYLFDDLVNSFEPTDTRTSRIITEWESTATGQLVMGLGNDQSFPYKLPFDPNAVGPSAGNDIVVIRYADILLTRAEALNELNGPTQEAIDLINQVRTRAGATPLNLGGFNKDSLRDAILREREWEFYFEGNAREDQIRHGVMISRAQARGKNAQDFHVLYPIPQRELDANPNLEQNPGY